MLLNGTLYITTDISVVNSCINTHKIILLGEHNPNEIINTPLIPASILLPPYEALVAEMDGNKDAFGCLYYQHLQSKEANEFICSIIYALIKGINLIFYLSKDEEQMLYSKFILEYLYSTFGIITGSDKNQFQFNEEFYGALICDTLYNLDIMDADEFLTLYNGSTYIAITLQKLVRDCSPYVGEEPNPSLYVKYFDNIRNNLRSNLKLISPISYIEG